MKVQLNTKYKNILIYLILAILLCVCGVVMSSANVVAEPTETTTQAPQHVVAQVKNLRQEKVTQNSITLKWDKADGAAYYNIYKYSEKKKKYNLVTSVEKTTYTVEKLSALKEYKFKVKGFYMDDTLELVKGKSSKELTGKTAPKAPATLISTDIGTDYISLSWKAVKGATSYDVYMYDRGQGKFVKLKSTTDTQFTATGLKKETIYNFKVYACYKDDKFSLKSAASPELLEFTDTNRTPKTNAQIAKRYNNSVNRIKSKSNLSVTYEKKVSTKAIYTSKGALLRTAKNILNMFNGSKKTVYNFSGGKSNGKTLDSLVQPYNREANLRAKDIKSFSLKEKDGKYTFTVMLTPDSAEFNGKTKTLSSSPVTGRAIRQVNITKRNITPVQLVSGTQSYNKNKITFQTGKNDYNLSSLNLNYTSEVLADCTVSTLKFKTKASYTINENYKFS